MGNKHSELEGPCSGKNEPDVNKSSDSCPEGQHVANRNTQLKSTLKLWQSHLDAVRSSEQSQRFQNRQRAKSKLTQLKNEGK